MAWEKTKHIYEKSLHYAKVGGISGAILLGTYQACVVEPMLRKAVSTPKPQAPVTQFIRKEYRVQTEVKTEFSEQNNVEALVKNLKLSDKQLNQYLGIGNKNPSANMFMAFNGWATNGIYIFAEYKIPDPLNDVQQLNNWNYLLKGKSRIAVETTLKLPQDPDPEFKTAVDEARKQKH